MNVQRRQNVKITSRYSSNAEDSKSEQNNFLSDCKQLFSNINVGLLRTYKATDTATTSSRKSLVEQFWACKSIQHGNEQSIGLHRSSWIHSIQASFLVSTATVASGNRRRSWQQKVAFGESRKVRYTLRNRLFKMSVLRKRDVCIIHCSRKRT